MSRSIVIREASRDALQGVPLFIPTAKKIAYLHKLLAVGFDVLDCVSFVSKQVIPQLQDSQEVLEGLENKALSNNRLLAVVANLAGAKQACAMPAIHVLGYPLSLSESFQQRNTRRSIKQALLDLCTMKQMAEEAGKSIHVFLSMAFGNPYHDPYSLKQLCDTLSQLQALELTDLSLADTLGLASPKQIEETFKAVLKQHPAHMLGLHLHALPKDAHDKVAAAYQAGCICFDAALNGYGGCPMAPTKKQKKLIGNLSTQVLLAYLASQGEVLKIVPEALDEAIAYATKLNQDYNIPSL